MTFNLNAGLAPGWRCGYTADELVNRHRRITRDYERARRMPVWPPASYPPAPQPPQVTKT